MPPVFFAASPSFPWFSFTSVRPLLATLCMIFFFGSRYVARQMAFLLGPRTRKLFVHRALRYMCYWFFRTTVLWEVCAPTRPRQFQPALPVYRYPSSGFVLPIPLFLVSAITDFSCRFHSCRYRSCRFHSCRILSSCRFYSCWFLLKLYYSCRLHN